MAYEDIIALANETGVDVWINVPALASDDYVCRLARLFRYGEQGDTSNTACDPSAPAGTATTSPINNTSKIYVEYSNEIWNWGFHQVLDAYCMVFGVPDQSTDGKVCSVTAPVSAIAAAALANSALPWNNSDKYSKVQQYFALWDTLVGKKQLFTYFTNAAGDGSWGAWGAWWARPILAHRSGTRCCPSPEPEATPTWTVSWTPQTARSFGRASERRECGGCKGISTTTGRSTRRTSPRSMQTSPARSVRHRDLKSNALTMETCAAGW
jgi:hypothetical protein